MEVGTVTVTVTSNGRRDPNHDVEAKHCDKLRQGLGVLCLPTAQSTKAKSLRPLGTLAALTEAGPGKAPGLPLSLAAVAHWQ